MVQTHFLMHRAQGEILLPLTAEGIALELEAVLMEEFGLHQVTLVVLAAAAAVIRVMVQTPQAEHLPNQTYLL